ncbi:hypothetical protein L917_20192 [Phytophthora nicotianae]|uniref:RxLR effector protein n=2 Tax=Phytophthora nicotianae TaxID=4792 RepID=W2M7S6_PHYNI|nr:hypothetical protein L915_20458 [Phytophthora nicotianae]ETL25894.1 hypothetical protein L916_20320 [Phytophthora nicotianae]ETL79101.1 hypothetical protein L917_20192 [Phytophthora nicotianae]ETM32365.1 hypothetical protein L914_20211 [Phytophthora nicotianae]
MKNPKSVNIAKEEESAWLDTCLDNSQQTKVREVGQVLDNFNKRYPDQKTTMIDGLRANYNDLRLLRIFDAAKSDPNTEKLAANLQNALVDTYGLLRRKPADLKRMRDGVPTSDKMIERYVKKLDALLENSL